jgi:hypothetical protein
MGAGVFPSPPQKVLIFFHMDMVHFGSFLLWDSKLEKFASKSE